MADMYFECYCGESIFLEKEPVKGEKRKCPECDREYTYKHRNFVTDIEPVIIK